MKVRLLLFAVAAALVAVVPATSATPQLLTGSFRTVIAGKSTQLNGTYVLKIDTYGQFQLKRNGKVVVKGAAAGASGKLAITDTSGSYACKGIAVAGAYTYTQTGNQLKLKATFDACSGRKTILTAHPRTKIA
jgi:hypothetical protein